MKWIFCPIDSTVIKENFDCGIDELDDYIKKYATQNQKKGVARTFVAIPEEGEKVVNGYYSVRMDKIEFEVIPEKYKKGLPRYPLPAMLIAKLAVDKSMQGTGLGKKLLMQCFRKAISLSSEVGVFAITVDAINEQARQFYLKLSRLLVNRITVDAINEQARQFYLKFGFIPLEDNTFSLFIPMKTVLTVFEQ